MRQDTQHNKNHLPQARRLRLLLPIILGYLLVFTTSYAQQGGLSRYVYDNNGRLHAVISPNGEAAIYEYDAAGNITAIRRNTASLLEVLGFSPLEGIPGTQVTIVGTGFGGGVSAVAFNGTTAQIVSVNAPVVIVTVPDGATTGLITVTTPQGSTNTSQPFTLKGIKVTPAVTSVNSSQTKQFSATIFPANVSQSVTWSVNDIDGGISTVGTISPTGLYTAPASGLFSSLTVRARSVADPNLFEDAVVMVGAIDLATTIASVGASVLVRRQPLPESTAIAAVGASVLVQRQPVPESTAIAATGLSVLATKSPYISAISPSQVARGTAVTVTINGANLTGVNTIRLSNGSGGVDANITGSNINVAVNGTSLTATLTVSAGAALGSRLLVVSTATDSSLSFSNGLNSIEIVP